MRINNLLREYNFKKTIYDWLFLTLMFNSCSNSEQSIPAFGKDQKIYEKPTSYMQAEHLEGKILDNIMYSHHLLEMRRFTIYSPPGNCEDVECGLLVVTDDIGNILPYFIEPLILSGEIKPLLIVGVFNRTEQPSDTIFGNVWYDFRNMEFLKEETVDKLTEYQLQQIKDGKSITFTNAEVSELRSDTLLYNIVQNRYARFCDWINLEIIPFIEKKYSITSDKTQRSIGGFSSGGAFVYSYSCDHQDIFGNAIVMSPAGPGDTYDFSNSKYRYYIAAGTEEPFIKESTKYLEVMDSLGLNYYHRTYNAGHDAGMWMDFYLTSVKMIYGK